MLACGGLDAPFEPVPAPLAPIQPVGPASPLPEIMAEPPELRDDDLILLEGRGSDGPVVIQYSDWKCPHCFLAMPRARDIAREHGVQLRFRNFPLAAPCNPVVTREDPERCELAVAAICAHRSDRFEEFASEVMDRPDSVIASWSREDPTFAACAADPSVAAIVRAQAETGVGLGLQGTPTFFARTRGEWREVGIDQLEDLLTR